MKAGFLETPGQTTSNLKLKDCFLGGQNEKEDMVDVTDLFVI